MIVAVSGPRIIDGSVSPHAVADSAGVESPLSARMMPVGTIWARFDGENADVYRVSSMPCLLRASAAKSSADHVRAFAAAAATSPFTDMTASAAARPGEITSEFACPGESISLCSTQSSSANIFQSEAKLQTSKDKQNKTFAYPIFAVFLHSLRAMFIALFLPVFVAALLPLLWPCLPSIPVAIGEYYPPPQPAKFESVHAC